MMTLTEVSRYLQLSEKTVLKMVKNGEIPSAKIANQWRFSPSIIDDWITARMNVVPQNDLSRLIEREMDYVSLSRLIDPGSIIMNMRSRDRDGVLRELADLAQARELVKSSDTLFSKLVQREQMLSTGIARGIAIPHIRRPGETDIQEPAIVFGRSPEGIDFASLDGTKTHFFFLLLSDSETVHIRIMSRLAAMLRRDDAREQLRRAEQPQDILRFFVEYEPRLYHKEIDT
ncbi:PTS sugar transporter subunit IIA [Salinispira pacifica]|nr:PTS sugar transporter subunit IIA [Salinispira pacifica]